MAFFRLIKSSLGFDYRSMALYRFLIGIMVMADVVYRIPDLLNFYTDVGLVPRGIFVSEMTMPWSFSLHLANGSYPFIVLMFSLHFLFGLLIALGFKTRWMMLGAYIMTVSVHNRNWMVNNGGDDVLRSLLFLSIFLPLNKWFSIDSAMQKSREKAKGEHLSFWVMAFTFQVFAIYFVSYVLKNHPIWRSEFTAIFYSSRLDIFATPIGIWLRDFPGLMKFSTFFTAYLEWIGPLMLIFSFLLARFWWVGRLLVIALFWGLHIGIIFTMWIGVFPYICLSMWLIFLPGPVWNWVLNQFRARNFGKLHLFFDAECGFCKKGVHLLREFLLLSDVNITPAQESPAINDLMLKHHSWVVVNENNDKFFHYSAFVEVIKHSPLLYWSSFFFGAKLMRKIGDSLYYMVSHNRPTMGKLTQFLSWRDEKKPLRSLRVISEACGALMMVTLIAWNLTTIKSLKLSFPKLETVTRWLHLYQEWNMFAPYPKMDNVWIEITGELSDGTMIEVITGSRDIFGIKDQQFYQAIPNEHWRKFYLNLSTRSDYARYYGGFLCRKWNERKIRWVEDTTLRKMEIVSYSQLNLPDGSKGGVERKLSWKHWCFDEDYKRENTK